MPQIDKALDMEVAIDLAYHIDHPCVDPVTGENIRDFYLRLAEKQIPKMKNPFARDFLELKLGEYR